MLTILLVVILAVFGPMVGGLLVVLRKRRREGDPRIFHGRIDQPILMPRVEPTRLVTIRLVDAHERKVIYQQTIDSNKRRPTMWWSAPHGSYAKYMATRQDKDGVWIYRQMSH